MQTKVVLEHFEGPCALARALTKDGWAITSSAISQWGDYPPMGRQLQIERLTNFSLKSTSNR